MNIGAMRYKVDILAGDPTTTLLKEGVWASAEDLGGRPLELAQMVSSETTHKFVIRNMSVPAGSFVRFEDKLFAVDYERDPGQPYRGMYLELYAHKVGDGA